MTFRFDSTQGNVSTFTDGPLSFTANCSFNNVQTNYFIQLSTAKDTTVYTEGLFAQYPSPGTATANLNSISVPGGSPTTIIGDGSGTTEQHDSTLLMDQGSQSWFVNADVQVTHATHRCQMLMLVVPST